MTTNSSSFLKGNSGLTLAALLILIVLILVYYFCGQGGGSLIEIKEPIKAPQGVAFIDVNGGVSNVQKVKVTLIDPEKMVVSSNGVSFNSVEITGGVMSIGLSSKASFSTDKPYRFYIRAEADGYMTNLRSVVITEDAPNYVPIYMTRLDNLPSSGLAAAVATVADVKSGVFQKTDTLKAIPRWAQIPPLSIVIKEGTKLLCDGKPIINKGPLSYRLLYGAPRDTNANRVFPGGFEVTDAVDENGKSLADPANPLFFTTAGWFSMEMNVGNEGVNSFSEPLLVEMPVSDTVINPETQQALKAGDKIPLWSLDNRTGVWKNESVISIIAGADGVLRASFPIKHLSTYNVDWKSTLCPGEINLSYVFGTGNTEFTGSHFTRLIDKSSWSEIKAKTATFDNTNNLKIIRYPAGVTSVLVVHTGNDATSPVYGISSGTGLSCPGSGSLIRSGVPGSCKQFIFQSVSAGGNPAVFCNNSVWFKDACNDPAYTFGGVIVGNSGDISLPNLSGNKCIRVWYLDVPTLTQETLDFDLFLGYPPGGTIRHGDIYHNGVLFGQFDFTIQNGGTCSTQVVTVSIPAGVFDGNSCL